MTIAKGGGVPPAASRKPRVRAHGRLVPSRDPLDIMLATMRWAHAEAEILCGIPPDVAAKDSGPTGRTAMALRAMALSAAKDAAPYLHVRRAVRTDGPRPGMRHEDALAELDADHPDDERNAEPYAAAPFGGEPVEK